MAGSIGLGCKVVSAILSLHAARRSAEMADY
jgi:hypothetical protein